MFTHSFTYLTRFAQALLIGAICGVLVLSTPANAWNFKRSDGNNTKNTVATQKADSKEGHSSQSASSSTKPEGMHASMFHRASSDPIAKREVVTKEEHNNLPVLSSTKPEGMHASMFHRADNDPIVKQPVVPREEHSNRPDLSPAKPEGPVFGNRPSDELRDKPDGRGNRRDNGPKPIIGKRTNHDSDKERGRTPDRGRDHDYNHPNNYRPPVHYNGGYHYPSHPSHRPRHYGYWVFDNYSIDFCRRSAYFHFGYFPYVRVNRIYVEPYIVVRYYNAPIVLDCGYYLARHKNYELDNTLSDIRNAWLNGRLDLIKNHVRTDRKIAVLLDGKYDYSIDADDYICMTSDAIDELSTASFTWESVKQRTDGNITAFGKHIYSDSSDTTKTVYVSYTLRKIENQYIIMEVGSSEWPLI